MSQPPLLLLLALASLPGCAGAKDARQPSEGNGAAENGDDSAEQDSSGGDASGGAVDGQAELRGVWVTRWTWTSAEEVEAILDDVADAGFNAVFFQVRGTHDAYYRSTLEPWASRLTGTLGADPGWDPLQVAIDKAHSRGMQLHAYLNTYPLWRGEDAPASVGVPHPLELHPEWLVVDSGGTTQALNSSYVFASPGVEAVREHLAKVALELTTSYEVDGVHLDYIRYPGSQYSHDAQSEAAYAEALAQAPGLPRADWQRAQVNEAAAMVRAQVEVPVTAAVWGIYEDQWGWSGVSQGNIDYFQDSRLFLETGAMDAIIPMIYWPVAEAESDRLDFRVLVRDHVSNRGQRHVYAGVGGETVDYAQVKAQIEVARLEGAQGVVLFDYSLFKDHMDDFKEDLFSEKAVPPAMEWR